MTTDPKLSVPVRYTAIRPPPPPEVLPFAASPPSARIVPAPTRFDVVSQTLPPDPPPSRYSVVLLPLAEMMPSMVVVSPTVIFAAPPPSVSFPAVNRCPALPMFVGDVIEP